jgi:hypothetical protein
MKRAIYYLLISILCLSAYSQRIIDYSRLDFDTIDFSNSQILKIEKDTSLGFNYPYFLYIPKNSINNLGARLLVEPNNSGRAIDDFSFHLNKAESTIKRSAKIADSLRVPFLVPVIPRTESNWKVYTHALDRDAMLIAKGDSLYRIDIQLLAMITNAQDILSNAGFNLKPKIFMMGFSASGNFTNRFAALHPDKVRAVASGAVNGLPIFPIDSIEEDLLIYPLGIGDIDSLLDISFDLSLYAKVSQFIYMGSFDRNDTYGYDDCFDDKERELIKKHFGCIMMPERWQKSQEIISTMNLPIQFVTYNGVTHTIKDEMYNDIITFFAANNQDSCMQIIPHEYPYAEYRYITNAHINKIYFPGDSALPDWARDLHGAQFAFGIEEFYINQDYRQLKEFLNNAGFDFKLKGENLEINITSENQKGTSSTGDGQLQIFYVKLNQADFDKIKSGIKYSLIPINENQDYTWTVNKDVDFIKPLKN